MSSDTRVQPQSDYTGAGKGYALSGKIMLSAIVILFFVVILMVCLHLYARWYLLNARRRHLRRNRHQRRTHLVFYVDPANPNPVAANRGLEPSVLKSLPVFVYSSNTHTDSLDCAVCLSEFVDNESGRVLPKCNHSFHIECIDMWFHSHSTCPLCRSPVEPSVGDEPPSPSQVVVPVIEPGCSSSELCATCQHEEGSAGTSSFGDRGKPRELMGVSIEVPPRNYGEGFENESSGSGCDSPRNESQTQSSFRSPVSRMLSFKRILSRERRGNSSPSSGVTVGGCVTEVDIERGREETRPTQC